MKKILIKNVKIITLNDENRQINDGFLGIENEKIDYVGTQEPEKKYDYIIDGKNKVLMPGLVNAHTHISMTLLRSYADDMNLQDWLFKKIFPIEDKMSSDDIYHGSMLGILEMIKSGTIAFADMYAFPDRTVQAAEKAGMYANISAPLLGGDDDCDTENNFFLNRAKNLYNDCRGMGGGRIKIDLAPHSVYTCTEKYLKTAAEFADKMGMDIHTHLSETFVENENCQKTYKVSPTKLLLDCGLLNKRTICAHGVFLSNDDMDILMNKNASVIHNPVSNLKLASGVAEVPKLMEKGINTALGTDGTASNNNLDLFEEIKMAAILHKGILKDPNVLPAADVLKMATANGYKALDIQNTGVIAEGYSADMILLDFDKPHLMPDNETISNIVYSANGTDVDTVIVRGKILMEHRDVKVIDEEKTKAEFKNAVEKLY